MKIILALIKKNAFFIAFILFTAVLFYPFFLKGQIPFSSNLLASYFNPFAQEKFSGWEQGIPNKPIGIDDLRIFYPQRHFTMQSLLQGSFPFWDPYTFSGSFHIGLSETAVFYPLNIVFFIFPQIVSWIILMFLEPIIAGIGMYLFLNSLVKEKWPAFFGGLVFGFSGIIIVRMVEGLSVGQTLIWFPFVIYGIERFLQKKHLRYLFISLISLILSVLSGWFQFSFYILIFSFIYCLFRIATLKKEKNYFYLFVFLPFILVPFIVGFHLLPAMQAYIASPREVFDPNLLLLHLMPVAHLLTLIFPDFWGNPGAYNYIGVSEYKESIVYIGAVPFVLSIFSLFLLKGEEKKTIMFFTLAAIVSLMLGINDPISKLLINIPVPVVSSFLPNRIFLIASFSLSVLSAYGMQFVLSSRLKISQYLSVAGLFLTLFIFTPLGIFLSIFERDKNTVNSTLSQTLKNIFIDRFFQIQEKNLIVPAIFIVLFFILLLFYIKFKNRSVFFYILIILVFSGQFYFAEKYIPWSRQQFVFPKNGVFSYLYKNAGINRFISTRGGYIQSNIPLFYGLYTPDGVGSMYIARYGQLANFAKTGSLNFDNIPRIEVRIDPRSITLLSGEDTNLLRFLQLDGVKYIVRLKTVGVSVDNNLFTKVWENNKWEIYEFNNSFPRIYFTGDFFVLKEDKPLLSKIFSNSSRSIGLEKNPGFSQTDAEGNVNVETYSPGKIIIAANSKGNGLVYVSDNYARQWSATVDSKNTEILRANYSFMAVPVEKGKHLIVMTYVENGETSAFSVFGVTLLFIVFGSFYLHRQRKVKF